MLASSLTLTAASENKRTRPHASPPAAASGLPGHRGVEWLRALGESHQATAASKEQADLVHAIYDRITVAGPEIVGVRLTQAGYAGAGTA